MNHLIRPAGKQLRAIVRGEDQRADRRVVAVAVLHEDRLFEIADLILCIHPRRHGRDQAQADGDPDRPWTPDPPRGFAAPSSGRRSRDMALASVPEALVNKNKTIATNHESAPLWLG